MNEQQRQIQRIKDNQKFLLKLLHLHIGNYYPLRRWLGIDYTGKIDEISHLSYGYDTQYFKKGTQWYKKQTRVYQQPDLGYKLNWILDSIPQAIIPRIGQPSWGLIQMRLARCSTYNYQPSTKDTYINPFTGGENTNYGSETTLWFRYLGYRIIIHFDTTDLPYASIVSQGDLKLYVYSVNYPTSAQICAYRMTRTNWTETGATWYKYDGTNPWTTPGGDYTQTNKTSITMPQSTGWATWSSSQLIQDCYDNLSKNVHLLMQYENISSSEDVRVYSNNYYDSAYRPKLIVSINDPVTNYQYFAGTTRLESPTLPETVLDNNLSCSVNLEANRWKKDTTHTQTWVKEPTHDKMYKS